MGKVKITTLEILKNRATPIVYSDLVEMVKKKTGNKNDWPNLVFKALTKDAGWTHNPQTGKFHPPEITEEQLVDVNLVLKLPISKVKELFSTII